MIYCADISKLNTDISVWLPILSKTRVEKLKQTQNEEKAKQLLGAELLLCYAMLQEIPNTQFPLQYQYSKQGKPFFESSEIHFSISHAGRYVACALSREPIGIDIQTHTAKDIKSIHKVLTKNQLDMIQAMPAQKHKQTLYDFWTLKESIIKYNGEGSLLTPMEFEFHNAGGRLGISYEDCTLRNYAILPNCSLGVCSTAPLSPYIFNLSLDQIQAKLEPFLK